MQKARLDGAKLLLAIAHRADFSRVSLKNANLEQMKGNDSVFVDADLSGARMRWSVLQRADLRGANLAGADLYLQILLKQILRVPDWRVQTLREQISRTQSGSTEHLASPAAVMGRPIPTDRFQGGFEQKFGLLP